MFYKIFYWNSYDKYDNLLRYRNEKPYEDLSLWNRTINNNHKITLINKRLLNYRIHNNQIVQIESKKNNNNSINFVNKEKRIGIFCICTGNYINYFKNLVKSVEKNFIKKYPKIYFISTDNKEFIEEICSELNIKYIINEIYHKGFPLDTLFRYKYLLEFDVQIELECDVIFYIDVDVEIKKEIYDDILPSKRYPLVGVKHPGFAYSNNKNGSLETNNLSTAYVDKNNYKDCYIAGGINGGITHFFLKMAKELCRNINIDKSKNIMAEWHDESHLNRYMIDNFDKFKILSTDYCYPENYYQDIPGKI